MSRTTYRTVMWSAIALVLILAVWLLTVWGVAMNGRLAFERGDYDEAADSAKFASAITPFERHKPHFNRGTAWAGDGNLGPARLELEKALELTPVRDECDVRINLAYVVEKQGDSRSSNATLAKRFFDHSRAILDASPPQCQPQGSSQSRKSEEAKARLDEKGKEQTGGDKDGDEKPKDEKEAKREQVQEKSKKAADRQEEADRQQRDGKKATGRGGQDGAKKPW